jgi:hypothetical protein
MFGKMKRWFGIEGVKVELQIPESINKKLGVVRGQLVFTTMQPQTVNFVKVVMIETYKRGRKQEKRIDDYEVGKIYLDAELDIQPEEPLVIDFELPFEMIKSEIDEFGDKNFLTKGIVNIAKRSRGVKSIFRIEVEADVKGTRLNPFDKKEIKLR